MKEPRERLVLVRGRLRDKEERVDVGALSKNMFLSGWLLEASNRSEKLNTLFPK